MLPHIASRFVTLDEAGLQRIREALADHYFSSPNTFPDVTSPEVYFATPEGAQDLDDHLIGRLHVARHTVVPWIDSMTSLTQATVLEVGCGTGSSTVAMAEQGAAVTAIDLDEDSIRAARERIAAYGLSATFQAGNAVDLDALVDVGACDVVVYYASVEHMTVEERTTSLATTWRAMHSGAILVIIDTPNRLWYFDHHTSFSNFFFWLPEELALAYASRTPRPRFRELLSSGSSDPRTALARWGRGVSYHDFELALGCGHQELDVGGCLRLFLQEQRSPFAARMTKLERDYVKVLRRVAPDVNEAWLLPNLDVALRKRPGTTHLAG